MNVGGGYDARQQKNNHENAANLGFGIRQLNGLKEDDD